MLLSSSTKISQL